MALSEPLVQVLTLMLVFLGFGYMILSKLSQTNPRMAERLRGLSLNNVMQKVKVKPVKEKMEQVWDDRRTMM